MASEQKRERFAPKVPVQLDPPKDDLISLEELAKSDGSDPNRPTLLAIKGVVFDVTRNPAYSATGQYRGEILLDLGYATNRDPSRALALSSLKPEDCVPEWSDLEDKEKQVLHDWFTFFSKRYNIVGKVEGATNT
ncbi:hypothetical protein N7495_000614 [Penicillium taxi]|uniref:uncharacterized protein n=1 Tax=Penicillium taxi TaxID=168475 RepID=UPI0025451A2D|nr:uncharacterized protein N7495_000614 [Penicillium taxi]KAJ5907932.1 hypothetical protein N7495_000614 [Penicillium taxi]